MRRLLATICAMLAMSSASEAKHISGGEMSYTHLGAGTSAGTGRYSITLRLYRDCNAPSDAAALDPEAPIVIVRRNASVPFVTLQVPLTRVERSQMMRPDPCFTNRPFVCFDVGVYTVEAELPYEASGYEVSYQQCCRLGNIANVANSGTAGAKYIAFIPGLSDHPMGPANNSPVFNGSDTVVVCRNAFFNYDFSARDVDGDSLVYEFAEAYTRTPVGAPYESLAYTSGFSFREPMGGGVRLDRMTGVMSGRAPEEGVYVVTVQVLEHRDGRILSRHRKDLQIRVADCSAASVELDSNYVNCDGFRLTFQNNNANPLIKTYSWDFGVAGATNDTSALERPSFTFPDTGVYRVRLITNRNRECTDTGYTFARVFPGFSGGFSVDDGCKGIPLAFRDTSKAAYGRVDSWRWDFGHPTPNPSTSTVQNPVHTYPANGVYDVRLIVGSDKGCRDTVDRRVNIQGRPSLTVPPDQAVCRGDSIRLLATGNGSFSWSPATGLSGTTVPDPKASPSVKTRYVVTLSNGPGCENSASVEIDVRSLPFIDAGRDTTVCLTDTVRLRPSTDGVRFSWQPTSALDDPSARNPLARPSGTTTYFVSAWLGSADGCVARDSVKVTTVPYPSVSIGADTVVCLGDSAMLRAAGGVSFRWSPSAGLSATDIPNPVASPSRSTVYLVEVRDDAGCPKPSFDSVLVSVAPRVVADAGRDTAIVAGQPFRLSGSGGGRYLWSPATGLSDPTASNPSVDIDRDQRYVLTVTGEGGCSDMDTVHIRVFQTAPDIFVPTAFTPNGDGLNDILSPLPVGIAEFRFFRVFNRWGQLVFSTTGTVKGWDGRVNGRPQPAQTLTWHVGGLGIDGRPVEKKGTTTLYR